MSIINKGLPCLSFLRDCVAVQLLKVGPGGTGPSPENPSHQYWMYDSGYLVFQGFLEANLKCFWDGSLIAAVRGLEYRGYICPGVLLVSGNPCALEVIRTAWTRNLLKPPANYTISLVGDVEECIVSKVQQGGFTPLPDAVCWVILQLGASGQTAVLETIKFALASSFPSMEQPSSHLLYDTLADLMASNKVYQTSQGYFVTTPDSLRLGEYANNTCVEGRPILMSTAEAVTMVHGEMITVREGAKTHQGIQTNLADVICGGNKDDKILYPRVVYKGHNPRRLERRHSMRLLGSSRRLATLHRAGSVRLLQHSTTSESPQPKKPSLLSRLFRWPKRSSSPATNSTFSTQFPPQEWFNSTVLHRHSVGTQTQTPSCSDNEWSPSAALQSRKRSLSTSRLPRRQNASRLLSSSRPSSPSIASSSKTVLCTTPPPKSLSSSSSGYNSLPRSKSRTKQTSTNNSVESSSPDDTKTLISHKSIKSLNESKEKKRPTSEIISEMKFPSSEEIHLEEKLLNNKNLKKEILDLSKAGSLIDVAHLAEKNNVRKASLSLSPLQPSNQTNDKVLDSLSYKNVFKSVQSEPLIKEGKNILEKEIHPFPSLSDLSVHFTSIAAQNILNGVSLNSIDTLVEVNMAAEKQNNRDLCLHTDLGLV